MYVMYVWENVHSIINVLGHTLKQVQIMSCIAGLHAIDSVRTPLHYQGVGTYTVTMNDTIVNMHFHG
jgi:hypothetical protein